MATRRKKSTKRRLNIRIDAELADFVKKYAASKCTTITHLVIDYFSGLQWQWEQNHADQI
jgi:uncharacterized protein (DUF1778 family)